MMTLFNFQFPESHKILFVGMQTFARNPKSTQFQFSRILNFQPHKIWSKGGIRCIFQIFPWHFYFMRGHSLVELTEHDDNAADIILHSM